MLDDFREQANEGSLFEDDDPLDFEELGDFDEIYEDEELEEELIALPKPKRRGRFMGLSALQRFVLSALLLVVSCLFSVLILLVSNRIVI